LQRLRVESLDLLQLHTCSEEMLRKGDVIEVLRRARDAGKTRFIGYSGDSKAALYAVECGAFDTLQTSVNIADQECITLTLPKAKAANMGVIAKRPIANVAWRTGRNPPDNGYVKSYWERLQQLAYPFLEDKDAAVGTALRFTLAAPGVTTAIVGTKNTARWKSNAQLLEAGSLPDTEFRAIRDRWKEASQADWVGQG